MTEQEDRSDRTKWAPLYPFKLVGRGICRLFKRGSKLKWKRQNDSPVASLTSALIEDDSPAASFSFERHLCNQYRSAFQATQTKEEGFPVILSSASRPEPQQLLAVGTRHWGNWWDGRGLLRVKIYDFALYANMNQARLQLGQHSVLQGLRQLGAANGDELAAQLVTAPDGPPADLSLVLRAARNIPLDTLTTEYRRTLQRRLARVGGSPADPAVDAIMACFDAKRMPSSSVCGDSVCKGSTITFRSSLDGQLTAHVGEHELSRAISPKLCQALFDAYLGPQPASTTAKSAASQTLSRLLLDPGHTYQPQGGERLVCSDPTDSTTCQVHLS